MKERFMSILLIFCMALILLPTTAHAAHPNNPIPEKDRWYYLRCMGNYLNLDADGNAELRDKTDTPEGNAKFFLHCLGNGGLGDAYALETEDGRYLGVDKVANGTHIILWTHIDKRVCPADPVPDGPEHSEFRFIPTDAPAGPIATPSKTSFVMNSKPVSVTAAYTINNTNYLQLREFAQKLSGTASQFNLYWDGGAGQAVIQPGAAYTGIAP